MESYYEEKSISDAFVMVMEIASPPMVERAAVAGGYLTKRGVDEYMASGPGS